MKNTVWVTAFCLAAFALPHGASRAVAAASNAAPVASSQAVQERASLRLTQMLFAAVLDSYAKEGLEKYRPDFLLHDRYIRTFLFEWGLALENGNAKSTKQIWIEISKRPSYLGANFKVWTQTIPHAFSANGDGTNIGFQREVFLVSVLRSEEITDFNERSRVVLDLVSKYLMPQSEDQELGLKIMDAFKSHPDTKLQAQAASLVRNFPALSNTVEVLGLTRDVALGLVLTPTTVASRISSVVMLRASKAVSAAQKARAVAMSVRTRLSTAIRFPELLAGWKRSTIVRASTYSALAHVMVAAAVTEKLERGENWNAPSQVDASVFTSVFRDSTPVAFLADLSLNTASERTQRTLEQKDFELPKQVRQGLTREQWQTVGKNALAQWNATNVVPKGFSFSTFILEGERLLGEWPKDEGLARLTIDSRYLRIKKRILENQIADIEGLRAELLKNELEDYRGYQPAFTAMLLDWGGNCVSQTSTFISLLLEFPKLIPEGSELGVFEGPGHREAVVMSKSEIKFLVSGSVIERTDATTVFKPQMLLARALYAANVNFDLNADSYYLNGRPEAGTAFVATGFLSNLKAKLNDIAHGEFNFKPDPFKSQSGKDTPPDVPDHARASYQAFSFASTRDGSSASSFFSSLSNVSSEKPEPPPKTLLIPTVNVPVRGKMIEVCIQDSQEVRPQKCVFSGKPFAFEPDKKGITHAVRDNAYVQNVNPGKQFSLATNFDGRKNLELTLAPEDIKTLTAQPRELWMFQLNKWLLEDVAEAHKLRNIPAGIASRAKQVTLEARDLPYLEAIDGAYDNSSQNKMWMEQVFASVAPSAAKKTPTESPAVSRGLPIEAFSSSYLTYASEMQNAYQARQEFAPFFKDVKQRSQQIDEWIVANRSLIEVLKTNPAAFVRAFTKLDPQVKTGLVKWGRGMSGEAFVPLRDYLNRLKVKDVILLETNPQVILKKPSLNPSIRTYVCTVGCGAFRVLKDEPAPTALQTKKENLLKESTASRAVQMAPEDTALLSLLSSGGLQLWNDKVMKALEKHGAVWKRSGLEIRLLQSTSDPSGFEDNVERIWTRFDRNVKPQDFVKPPTVAVEKALGTLYRRNNFSSEFMRLMYEQGILSRGEYESYYRYGAFPLNIRRTQEIFCSSFSQYRTEDISQVIIEGCRSLYEGRGGGSRARPDDTDGSSKCYDEGGRLFCRSGIERN